RAPRGCNEARPGHTNQRGSAMRLRVVVGCLIAGLCVLVGAVVYGQGQHQPAGGGGPGGGPSGGPPQVGGGGGQGPAFGGMMMARAGTPKWEYLVKARAQFTGQGHDEIAAGLNKLGDEGWELVSIDAGSGLYVFKRAKAGTGGRGVSGMM